MDNKAQFEQFFEANISLVRGYLMLYFEGDELDKTIQDCFSSLLPFRPGENEKSLFSACRKKTLDLKVNQPKVMAVYGISQDQVDELLATANELPDNLKVIFYLLQENDPDRVRDLFAMNQAEWLAKAHMIKAYFEKTDLKTL